MPNLKELILDGNPIASNKELAHLKKFSKLTDLSAVGCPMTEGDDFKKEVLIHLYDDCKHLKKINGEPFTAEDVQEAMALKVQRQREAEGKPPVEENPEEEAPAEDE